MQIHEFLHDLAVVLCVAAVTSVLFRKLRQPVVLGYLLAGLIVGPYIPIPLVADLDRVHIFSELGVILVMFAIGLEFSFRKLANIGVSAGIIAILQISVMLWLGYLAGGFFNYTNIERFFTGAIISISSTMIIVKAFQDRGIGGRLASIVVGVLIIEDLFAILILAVLTAMASPQAETFTFTTEALKLLIFFAALIVVGILIVPRGIRLVAKFKSSETLLIASIGVCFAFALIAQKFGYSVALGSFVGGMLVAESGHASRIEHLVKPLRDVFAAIFFVSVGMLMNPADLAANWQAVVLLTFLVIAGKALSVFAGAFLSGNDMKTSVQAGMSMAQIGEFSFILASAGLASQAVRPALYPIAIAICVITTFTTPGMIASSGKVSNWLANHLPERLQAFVALYSGWVQRLGNPARTIVRKRRRLLWILALDITAFAIIISGFSIVIPRLSVLAQTLLPLNSEQTVLLINAMRLALITPFLISIIRCARSLGTLLSMQAMPVTDSGKLDLAEAPRRTLRVTLEISVVLIASVILIAITQPFVPAAISLSIFVLTLLVSLLLFWKEAAQLQGHFRAGIEAVAAALMPSSVIPEPTSQNQLIQELLPGLGNVTQILVTSSSSAAGKSLGELNIRGISGATVIAIIRGSNPNILPQASEVLQPGDIAALSGSDEAIALARKILEGN